jgi:hypothetical protein
LKVKNKNKNSFAGATAFLFHFRRLEIPALLHKFAPNIFRGAYTAEITPFEPEQVNTCVGTKIATRQNFFQRNVYLIYPLFC